MKLPLLLGLALVGWNLSAQVESGFRVQVETYSSPSVVTVAYEVPAGANLAHYSAWEYGDDIRLAGTARVLSGIEFEYYSNYARTDGWTFRLYGMDASGLPGELLYATTGDILNGGAQSRIRFGYDAVNNQLPDQFFYTLQFAGIGEGQVAGLIVPDRLPSTGSSAPGFIMRTSDGWADAAFDQQPGPTGPLAIVEPPSVPDPSLVLGDPVSLRVVARGLGTLTYQWRHNGVRIPGATQQELVLPSFQLSQAGDYVVVVSDGTDAVSSDPVRLEPELPTLPFVDGFQTVTSRPPGIAGLSGSGKGDNLFAAPEASELRHGPNPPAASVWLAWTADATGIATLSTLGSDFDTVLAVYEAVNPGTPVFGFGDLRRVAANDEADASTHASQVQFNVEAGRIYYLAVDGNGSLGRGGRGQIIFSWNLEPATQQLPEITQLTEDVAVDDTGAAELRVTAEAPAGAILTIRWFRLGPAGPEPTGVTGEVLDLNSLPDGAAGTYFAELSAEYPDATVRTIRTNPVEVQEYSRSNDSDRTVFARDQFSRSRAEAPVPRGLAARATRPNLRPLGLARGVSGTQMFTTAGCSTDPGEPQPCGVPGGASKWYALLADADGVLEVDTAGSSFDTVMAIYYDTGEGTELFDGLVEVACNNDAAPILRTSAVSFCAQAGNVYYVLVDGVGGAAGTVRLNYRLGVGSSDALCPLPALECPGPVAVRVAPPGGGLTLAPELEFMPPVEFQWFRNGVPVIGAAGTTLPLSALPADDSAFYTLRMRSAFGETIVPVARVRVGNGSAPLLGHALHCDGALTLYLAGTPGRTLILESATDFENWSTLAVRTPADGQAEFTLSPEPPGGAQHFRVREE